MDTSTKKFFSLLMQMHTPMIAQESARWRYLGLSCLTLWSLSYCYDIPAAIHDHLAAYSGLSATDFPWFFNALYAGYSFPNLILPLFFGFFADSPSLPTIIGVLSVAGCLGQLLFHGGVYYHIHWLAIFGRVVYGIGCESLGVALSSVLTHCFHRHELAFALSVSVSFARIGMLDLVFKSIDPLIGTIANDWVSPVLSLRLGTTAPFVAGSAFAIVAVITAMILVKDVRVGQRSLTTIRPTIGSLISVTKELKSTFWATGLVCAFGYSAILPFTSVFVANRPSGLTQETASQIVSIVFLVCVLISPIIASGIDRFGNAAWVVCAACLLLCITHSMFPGFDQIYIVAILGLAYAAFVASIWPMVPLTVTEAHVGLGYGLVTTLQNAALVMVPLITASIKAESGSYEGSRYVFLVAAFFALGGSVWLAFKTSSLYSHADETEDETLPLTAVKLG
jgi:MFS family permease